MGWESGSFARLDDCLIRCDASGRAKHEESLLMTSTVLAGHARLSGSFSRTSAVLKMP